MVPVSVALPHAEFPLLSGLQLAEFISAAPRAFNGHSASCGLQHLGILAVESIMDSEEECLPPGPDLVLSCGVPLAHEQGAEGVCTAIGGLVQSGVLPALKEVSALSLCSYKHMALPFWGPLVGHKSSCAYILLCEAGLIADSTHHCSDIG